MPQKKPQVLLPAARHQLDCALITAGRLLPEEVQEEAKAQAAINASQILAKSFIFTRSDYKITILTRCQQAFL
jgi:hypothetical protein